MTRRAQSRTVGPSRATVSRRAFVGRGAALGAVAWTVPAIVSTTPVAAATGSCVQGWTICEFSGGLEGWTIDNEFGPGTTGLWNHSTDRDGGALHYGRGASGNYATGSARNSGAVTSPPIEIPATGNREVRFSVFRAVETHSTNNRDVVSLTIIGTSKSHTLWSAGSDGGTGGSFVTISSNIQGVYKGDTVVFRFDFDTVNGQNNGFEGIYIGRFEVTGCAL